MVPGHGRYYQNLRLRSGISKPRAGLLEIFNIVGIKRKIKINRRRNNAPTHPNRDICVVIEVVSGDFMASSR